MTTSLARRILGIRLGVFHQHPPQPLNPPSSTDRIYMSAGLPSISLVTPSFNQGSFIGETIKSVLTQQYPHLQYLIQDAGSTDQTSEILCTFPSHAFDKFIERDRGQADAINRGFSRSDGEIMAWLNSDDLLLPGALHLVGEYFQHHPEVDVVYGNRFIIDSVGNEVGRWVLPGHDANVLRGIDYVPQETLFWRRRVWDQVGGRVDDTLNFALDWDLLLRFCDAGAKFAHLPILFGAFRVHESQKTNVLFRTSGHEEIRLLCRRFSGSLSQRFFRAFQHALFLLKHIVADYQFRHKNSKNRF